jgi:hypothetical protein
VKNTHAAHVTGFTSFCYGAQGHMLNITQVHGE